MKIEICHETFDHIQLNIRNRAIQEIKKKKKKQFTSSKSRKQYSNWILVSKLKFIKINLKQKFWLMTQWTRILPLIMSYLRDISIFSYLSICFSLQITSSVEINPLEFIFHLSGQRKMRKKKKSLKKGVIKPV